MFLPYQVWINENPNLDSYKNNIRISDIDSFIQNYRTGDYMLLEWKCRNAIVKFPQTEILQTLHNALKASGDKRYCGFGIIRLSGETPADGEIHLSGELILNDTAYTPDKVITESELTKLLQLNWRNTPKQMLFCELSQMP